MTHRTRRPTKFTSLVTLAVACGSAWAFCPLEVHWTGGAVTMSHNFPPSGLLLNNTTSWEQNAENAMAEWSNVTSEFRFINGSASGAGQSDGDGINNMLFANNVGGDEFGEDVLALTLTRTNSLGVALESDIIFNSNTSWNAFDGPIRLDAQGHPLFDFHRVALHELGHVLGLDHPDEACEQTVQAVMNARTTDTDQLANDDRNGVSFIYGGGNTPPIAKAGPDQGGDGSVAFLLNAGESYDPDGVIVSYDWQLNGVLVAAGRFTEVILSVGTHVIMLTVTDDQGAVDSDSLVIAVGASPPPGDPNNTPPVADAGDDLIVATGSIVQLDGSGSFDPDGAIDRFVWSSGGTIIGRDPVITLSLGSGTHEITLTVFDNGGAANSDVLFITVTTDGVVDDGPVVTPPDEAGGEPNPPATPSPCGTMGWITLLAGMVLPMGVFRRGARASRKTRLRD